MFPSNTFSLDVKFDQSESKIVASRFIIQAINITDGNVEKDMVSDLRRIARESPLNVTVYHPYFVFFDQVRTTFLIAFIIKIKPISKILLIVS